MMYYAIYCEDKENSLERRRSVRPAHLTRLSALKAAGRLMLVGQLLNEDNENPVVGGIKGSLIVAAFTSLSEAEEWAAADPYVTADVYARVTISPFKEVMSAL